MSVGTVILECTGCGASFSRGVLYGEFWYVMPSGERYPLDRMLGWCRYCALMVPVEDLSGDSVGPEIEKWTRWEAQANTKLKYSIWARLFGDEKETIKSAERELALLRGKLNFLKQRRSSPKCLECGSDEVELLPDPPWPQEEGQVVAAGWRHPLCGGEMVAKALPGRFHFSYPERLYDPNGRSI